MVGGVEKWEDRKYFNFPYFCLVETKKVKRWKKISLYKFNYIPLLKNDTQLKKKSDKQVKKKINHPNLLKTKNHV